MVLPFSYISFASCYSYKVSDCLLLLFLWISLEDVSVCGSMSCSSSSFFKSIDLHGASFFLLLQADLLQIQGDVNEHCAALLISCPPTMAASSPPSLLVTLVAVCLLDCSVMLLIWINRSTIDLVLLSLLGAQVLLWLPTCETTRVSMLAVWFSSDLSDLVFLPHCSRLSIYHFLLHPCIQSWQMYSQILYGPPPCLWSTLLVNSGCAH